MLTLIKDRRSHFLREFNGNKAPNSIIQEMLEASIWAPSHRLTLPFRYEVFPPNQLGYLATAIESSYRKNEVDIDPLKIEKIQSFPEKLSHALAVIFKPSGKIPEWEEYASLGAAVQNMYLQLSSHAEFGGYWTTGNEINSVIMREFLQLVESEVHCGYFFVGGIDHKRTKASRPAVDVNWR
jgi:hypothetical protein